MSKSANPDVLVLVRHALKSYRHSAFKTSAMWWTISGAAERAARASKDETTARELFSAFAVRCGIPEERALKMRLPGEAAIRAALRALVGEGVVAKARVRGGRYYVPAWKLVDSKNYKVSAA